MKSRRPETAADALLKNPAGRDEAGRKRTKAGSKRNTVGARLEAELVQTAAFRSELRRFLHRVEEAASTAELTAQRYDLLLMIKVSSAGSGATVGSLCESLDLQQTAVTELVKRAVTAGLITRDQSPDDRRVFRLRLTEDGETRLMAVFHTLAADREALADSLRELHDRFHG